MKVDDWPADKVSLSELEVVCSVESKDDVVDRRGLACVDALKS